MKTWYKYDQLAEDAGGWFAYAINMTVPSLLGECGAGWSKNVCLDWAVITYCFCIFIIIVETCSQSDDDREDIV
jgi:hypothetical protein